MSINGQTDNEDVLGSYKRMLLSIRKEEEVMDLEDNMLSEINQTKEDEHCMISVPWNLKSKLIKLVSI